MAESSGSWGGRRPGAGSGGARPRSGPLREVVQLKPFDHAVKGPSISAINLRISRCNACGRIGWSRYNEIVRDGAGNLIATYDHDAESIDHRSDCPIGGI